MNISFRGKENVSDKWRNELKYVCTESELYQLEFRVEAICKRDLHAGNDGIYGIRSVYFDDIHEHCYYENENGTDPREKFRIRMYNADASYIVLECKKKEKMKTHKESVRLSKGQCMDIITGNFENVCADTELMNKFLLECRERMLRPKVIVEYERTPFVYQEGNVRITFDRNIGSTTRVESFFEKQLPIRPVMPLGQHIFEVKYDEFLPDFLYVAMNLRNLRQTAFSKYYICRKYTF